MSSSTDTRLVEQLADEFLSLLRQGTPVDPEDWYQRHPEHADELRQMIGRAAIACLYLAHAKRIAPPRLAADRGVLDVGVKGNPLIAVAVV